MTLAGKLRQSIKKKRNTMITLREQSRGVFSSFMFLQGRLAMPSSRRGDWEHATLLSVQGSVVTSARKKEEEIDSMETVWSFFNGGCHPVQKWLKDRKTRTLTADDIFHYKSIVIAIMETFRLISLSAMADEWMTLSLNHNEIMLAENDAQSLPS